MKNEVVFEGFIKKLELKYTQSGSPVCNMTLKNEVMKKDKTFSVYMRTVTWGSMAETINLTLKEGDKTTVEGRLQVRTWEDRSGKKNYITEIVTSNVEIPDTPEGEWDDSRKPLPKNRAENGYQPEGFASDNIPF